MKTASGLAMAVVVVALLVAGGTALKLYMDQQSMLVMIDGYGRAVSGLSTTTPGTASAVATANQHAGVGDYEAAGQALDQVLTLVNQTPATPQGPAGPGGPGPGGMMPNYGFGNNPGAPPAPTDEQIDDALNEVPEETRAFFAEHRKLLGRLMVQNQTTMGAIDPDEWNQYTAVVLGAAADGDADTVKGAMDRFDQALQGARQGGRGGRGGPGGPGGPGGRGGRMPGQGPMPEGGLEQFVRAQLQQGRQIAAEAKKRGRNTKKVEELLARAETLAGQGKFEEAAARLREGVDVMRSWGGPQQGRRPGGQRGAGGRMGPGGRGMGPGGRRPGQGQRMQGGPQQGNPMMMAQMLFGALMGQMEAEEPLIFSAIEDIENAVVALLPYNPEQIKEILSKAKKKLTAIPESRVALDKKLTEDMQQRQGPPREGDGPRGGGRGGRGPGPNQGRGPGGRGPGGMGPGGRGPGPGNMGPGMGGPPLDPQQVQNLLGRMIDNARNMPAEQYEAEREGLIGRFMARLMGRPAPEGPPMPQGGDAPPEVRIGAPVVEIPEEDPADPVAREELETQVRDLMRLMQVPYLELKRLDIDTELELVDELIKNSRDEVNADKLLDAAGNANHASELIFQLLEIYRADLEALPVEPELVEVTPEAAG